MVASKTSLWLLNFATERRWFDLFIAEFRRVFNWCIFLMPWGHLI